VATGRSDFPNQVNNVLAFPGIFRGVLDVEAKVINEEIKVAAAEALADIAGSVGLSKHYIIPKALDMRVGPIVAGAVAQAASDTGVAIFPLTSAEAEKRASEIIFKHKTPF
jgi:malate dehydrogenase (oxaloacetate-decarboxylating)